MDYQQLLDEAPPHDTPEFIEYLRGHNTVVEDTDEWLIIENCKYHTKETPHLTAFAKNELIPISAMSYLLDTYPQYDLLIKSTKRRTVTRLHVHLIDNSL